MPKTYRAGKIVRPAAGFPRIPGGTNRSLLSRWEGPFFPKSGLPLLMGCMAVCYCLNWATSASAASGPYRPVPISAPAPLPNGQWGERLAAAGDLNSDGSGDVFVGSPMEESGKVYALDGRALSHKQVRSLYEVESPEPLTAPLFGFAISAAGDLDGDRIPDLAAGGTEAWTFSGKDGELLTELPDPDPQPKGRFGNRIGRAGDLNGDTVPEVMVAAPENDVPPNCSASATAGGCWVGQGQVFLFNGSDGTLFRTLDLPLQDRRKGGCASDCGYFGQSVQGPGDVDLDGTPDQLVSAPGYKGKGRLYLFSGKTGELLRRVDSPDPQDGASFGFQDAAPLAPGDVNGDGAADIYGNGFLQNGRAGTGQGRAWVFSGKTGKSIYELRDPTPQKGGQFGWSMTSTDHDGNDRPDLYVGSSPHHVPGSPQAGGTYVFKGESGALLQSLELPKPFGKTAGPADLGPNLGWSIAAPGDLNGDRLPDYVAGAPFTAVGANPDQGVLFAFLSAKGSAAKSGEGTRAQDGLFRNPWGKVFSAIAVLVVLGASWLSLARRAKEKS